MPPLARRRRGPPARPARRRTPAGTSMSNATSPGSTVETPKVKNEQQELSASASRWVRSATASSPANSSRAWVGPVLLDRPQRGREQVVELGQPQRPFDGRQGARLDRGPPKAARPAAHHRVHATTVSLYPGTGCSSAWRTRSSVDLAAALEQDGVAPDAVELGDRVAHGQGAVAGGVVQGEAGPVLGEDRGLQRPETGRRRPR